MKFRTELQIAPMAVQIDHQNSILALGSCFAEHIAGRLARAKFATTVNPSGILFNPLSIAAALHDFADGVPVREEELGFDGQQWFHDSFHSDFSATTAQEALQVMNAARRAGAEALRQADRLLLTFGTAWVYERDGSVVANCHRRDASAFVRRRVDVGEVVAIFSRLIEGPLAHKQIILTVSPVRHLGDGLQGNAASKAVLRLAAEELAEKYANVHYFPAFELLIDDLRDYRFYADDMVHPTPQAVSYVWEKFAESLFSEQTQALVSQIERIVTAAEHRPRNPHSVSHGAFCRQMLDRIAALPQVDFSAEAASFGRFLEI